MALIQYLTKFKKFHFILKDQRFGPIEEENQKNKPPSNSQGDISQTRADGSTVGRHVGLLGELIDGQWPGGERTSSRRSGSQDRHPPDAVYIRHNETTKP